MTSYANDAKYQSDWSGQSAMTYEAFLQAKQFEKSLRFGIAEQTKELIASNQELMERGISVLQSELGSGFSLLSQDISHLQSRVVEVRNAIDWGFSQVFMSLGRVADSLDELVKLARTPSQVWAYEQFDIARDEFRRQLFAEATESIARAIDGFGSNTGYKTEFRFHFLLGTLRLGDYKNNTLEVVRPAEAEQAFANAARFAQPDFPVDAGRSLICAGRAALVQGKIAEAAAYTERGLQFVGEDATGLYQMARLCSSQGDAHKGADYLYRAVVADTGLALAAASIPEFSRFLPDVLRRATDTFKKSYTAARTRFEAALQDVKNWRFQEFVGASVLANEIEGLNAFQRSAAPRGERLFSYETATHTLSGGASQFVGLFPTFRERIIQELRSQQAKIKRSIHGIEADSESEMFRASSGSTAWVYGAVAAALCVVASVVAFDRVNDHIRIYHSMAGVGGLALLSILGFWIGTPTLFFLVSWSIRAASKARQKQIAQKANDQTCHLEPVIQDLEKLVSELQTRRVPPVPEI